MDVDAELAANLRRELHEVNNVLNTISMQSELVRLLARNISDADQLHAALDIIAAECKKGGEVTRRASQTIQGATDDSADP